MDRSRGERCGYCGPTFSTSYHSYIYQRDPMFVLIFNDTYLLDKFSFLQISVGTSSLHIGESDRHQHGYFSVRHNSSFSR